MPYIGDGARRQAVSQKNEQFADFMDGGYIAHVWLRDGALIDHAHSNQRYELALGVGVPVDVPLGGLNGTMTGQQLNVPQRTTGLVGEPGGPGDEGAPARMGRAAVETDVVKCTIEPDHDTEWRHRATALRSNDRTHAGRETSIACHCRAKVGVNGDQSAAAVLGRGITQLDHRTDFACWIEHHVPGQLRDLTGPQARLGGEQDDHPIAKGMPGAAGENQEVADVA